MEENGVDALETDKKGHPTSEYISFTKLKEMSMHIKFTSQMIHWNQLV
ncbi:hypothetical protein [Peribacillus simplex]|nr:hypothetical protein [Peribacillus simplex]